MMNCDVCDMNHKYIVRSDYFKRSLTTDEFINLLKATTRNEPLKGIRIEPPKETRVCRL